MPEDSCYHASDGAAYGIFLGRWTRELAAQFLDFAAFPADGRPLLDVGTGTGSLAFAMAKRWTMRQIVGIDVAAPYIAYARARTKSSSPAFEIGDAAAIRKADGLYSGAAAQLVLNFVPNAPAAVREMKRVTRPGGTVAAAVWDFRGGLVYQRMFWDTVGASTLKQPMRAISFFPVRWRCRTVCPPCSGTLVWPASSAVR